MALAGFQVRRATLDDIGALTALWQTMQFPVEELSRRITEFQVICGTDGQILGAIGMQVAEKQGLIHSEAFHDFSQSETFRPALWERLHSLATNHGLTRIWTRETAPFYRRAGMETAPGERLQEIPKPWKELSGEWLTQKLREDLSSLVSADKEFEVFMALERDKTQRTLSQGQAMKTAAKVFAGIVCLLLLGALIYLVQHSNLLQRR